MIERVAFGFHFWKASLQVYLVYFCMPCFRVALQCDVVNCDIMGVAFRDSLKRGCVSVSIFGKQVYQRTCKYGGYCQL